MCLLNKKPQFQPNMYPQRLYVLAILLMDYLELESFGFGYFRTNPLPHQMQPHLSQLDLNPLPPQDLDPVFLNPVPKDRSPILHFAHYTQIHIMHK